MIPVSKSLKPKRPEPKLEKKLARPGSGRNFNFSFEPEKSGSCRPVTQTNKLSYKYTHQKTYTDGHHFDNVTFGFLTFQSMYISQKPEVKNLHTYQSFPHL